MDSETDGGGAASHGMRDAAPQIQSAATPHGSRATISPVSDIAVWREWRAWLATAQYLNAAGYAAPVPASLVAPLRRRGLCVWAACGDAT